MLKFDIITIFPNIFTDYFSTSIIKRAQQRKLIKIKIHNLRKWTTDKHRTVDDKPYGGGPGMILKIEPIYKAVCSILRNPKSQALNPKQISKSKIQKSKTKIILFSPKGKKFDQKMAKRFSKLDRLIMICGRYEGVDERVAQHIADEEVSVGDYVVTGGELPAMIVVDAVSRLIPRVIKKESLKEESFSICNSSKTQTNTENFPRKSALSPRESAVTSGASGEYPQYTRPEVLTIRDKSGKIKKLKVPSVLLSGNHQRIREWRNRQITKNQ